MNIKIESVKDIKKCEVDAEVFELFVDEKWTRALEHRVNKRKNVDAYESILINYTKHKKCMRIKKNVIAAFFEYLQINGLSTSHVWMAHGVYQLQFGVYIL